MSEIKQYAGVNVTDKQLKLIEKFNKKHKKCFTGSNNLEIIISSTGNGLGTTTRLKCSKCKKIEDITDVSLW